MVNSYGKLRGEGTPNRMWIVWTDGWVEPVDMWMMVTLLGWWPCGHHPRTVTIIHISAAPNPRVGPPTLPYSWRAATCSKRIFRPLKSPFWRNFRRRKSLKTVNCQWSQVGHSIKLNPKTVILARFSAPKIVKSLNRIFMDFLGTVAHFLNQFLRWNC